MCGFSIFMVARSTANLTWSEAQDAVDHIADIIWEFLDSIDKQFPGVGYRKLADDLVSMKTQTRQASQPFLDAASCDSFINQYLQTFTNINNSIDQNLQDFNSAYTEIANFFASNQTAGNFQLTNYGNPRIEQMVKINSASNIILPALKKNPNSIINLYASFAVHSSKTEMAEYALLKEIQNYHKIMGDNSSQVSFDPVEIFSLSSPIQDNRGNFMTEGRAIRNLIDHHKYDVTSSGSTTTIKFDSQADSSWRFTYSRTFTVPEFVDYLALLDFLYKCIVNILFTYQLLAVLRNKFVV